MDLEQRVRNVKNPCHRSFLDARSGRRQTGRCKVKTLLTKRWAVILRTCSFKLVSLGAGADGWVPVKIIMDILRAEIERLYAKGSLPPEVAVHARHAFREFHEALTRGEVRAAEKQDGQWRVNAWVKQGILLGFRLGELEESNSGPLSFVDKDTFPARQFRPVRPCSRGAWRIVHPQRRLYRSGRNLYAADVR